jgi:hypothetical protein
MSWAWADVYEARTDRSTMAAMAARNSERGKEKTSAETGISRP